MTLSLSLSLRMALAQSDEHFRPRQVYVRSRLMALLRKRLHRGEVRWEALNGREAIDDPLRSVIHSKPSTTSRLCHGELFHAAKHRDTLFDIRSARGGIMRRRDFMAMLGGASVGWPLSAGGQALRPPYRIGLLETVQGAEGERARKLLKTDLANFGWIDGRDIVIVERSVGSDVNKLRAAAHELAEIRPDVIVTVGSNSLSALLRETRTVPIVFVQVVDALSQGFVESLAHPGGNITGFTSFEPAMVASGSSS
jgi:hypothetical protein